MMGAWDDKKTDEPLCVMLLNRNIIDRENAAD
jgi:hypothetical protein